MDIDNSIQKEVPVFYPTYDEFKNLSAYILSQEQYIIRSQCGAFKIVPPLRWIPVTNCFSDIRIKSYLTQNIMPTSKNNHIYHIKNTSTTKRRHMSYDEFKRLAESESYRLSDLINDVEEHFWTTISDYMSATYPPLYAADIHFSLFAKKETTCNFNHLKSLLNYYPANIKGITSPFLYVGMWGSVFGMHTEDCDLYSLNYLHHGAAKIWYVIPEAYAERLENFVYQNNLLELTGDEKLCTAPLQHKTLLINPHVLRQHNIEFHKIVQKQNEIVVILPRSYHFGFNCGLNIAEAINYALPSWINYGLKTKMCSCVHTAVKLNMNYFTKDVLQRFEQDVGSIVPTSNQNNDDQQQQQQEQQQQIQQQQEQQQQEQQQQIQQQQIQQQQIHQISQAVELFNDIDCRFPDSTHNELMLDDPACVDFDDVQLFNDISKVYTYTSEMSSPQKNDEDKWKHFEDKLMNQIRVNMSQYVVTPTLSPTQSTHLHTVPKRMRKRKCYCCQRYGHYKDYCPKYLAIRNK